MRRIRCSIVMSIALATTATAASVSINQSEAFAETEGENAAFIQLLFGPDSTSPLDFTYTFDLATLNFAYSLNAGSTYEGSPITLSGSGIYDSSTDTWAVSSSGSLGAKLWDTSGSVTITPDPTLADILDISTSENLFDPPPKKADIHFIGVVNRVTGASSGVCRYTDASGADFGPAYNCLDQHNPDGSVDFWVFDGGPSGFYIDSSGTISADGTSGTYTTVISAIIPEPASGQLFLLALAGIIAFRGVRGRMLA